MEVHEDDMEVQEEAVKKLTLHRQILPSPPYPLPAPPYNFFIP